MEGFNVKKILYIAAAVVLAISLLAGCGKMNSSSSAYSSVSNYSTSASPIS